MREQFKALSMDESGAVTSNVFTQAMTRANVEVSEAENLFRCLDVDGDGEIAFSEFLAGASQFNYLAAGTLYLSFGRFDVDGDGKVTSKDLRAVLGKSFFKKQNVEDWLLEVGDSDGAVSLEMFSVFMRQGHEWLEEVNAACAPSDTRVRTRSVSMTSMQSQDQEKFIQKAEGFGEPAKQSEGKNLLDIAASQPGKSALAHATHSFSNQFGVK